MNHLYRSKSSLHSSRLRSSSFSVTPITLSSATTGSSSSSSSTPNCFDLTPRRKYNGSPYPVDNLPVTGDYKVDQFFKFKSPYDESLQLSGDFELINLPAILHVLKKYRNLTTLTSFFIRSIYIL